MCGFIDPWKSVPPEISSPSSRAIRWNFSVISGVYSE